MTSIKARKHKKELKQESLYDAVCKKLIVGKKLIE